MRCGVAFHRCGPTNQGQFRAWLLASVWITASAAIPTETSAQTAAEPPASAEPNIQQLPQVVVRAPAAPERPVQRRTARQANTPASRPPVPSAVPAAAAGPRHRRLKPQPSAPSPAKRSPRARSRGRRKCSKPRQASSSRSTAARAKPGITLGEKTGWFGRAALPLSGPRPLTRTCVPLPGDSAAQRAAWVPVRRWLAHRA